jgi:hypothetical protein
MRMMKACAAIPLLLLLIGLSSCATTQQITSGNTNQCINVPMHGYPVAGTPVIVKQCDPWRNQLWTLQKGQITGNGGFCLDVQGSAPTEGAPVVYVPCSGSPSQNWSLANNQIVGIGGLCMDIGGSGDPVNGAPLVISACKGTPSQQWLMH